jgi:CRISPR-associated protein Cas1
MTNTTIVPDLVPARMINETLYCERLLHLEWAQGEFADNYFTVDGNAVHKRADHTGGELPPLDGTADDRPYQARSVWLSSEKLGITAKIDVVDGDRRGVVPIEYKRGEAPDLPEGAYLPERAQLCAQVLLLREHGYNVERAEIYFAKSRRRVEIAINAELVASTLIASTRAREICASTDPPPPLVASPKCNGCSLIGICLPDETNFLRGQKAESATLVELRRLHPARDDKSSLHVQEQGAKIGLRGDCLVVRGRDGSESTPVRMLHTSNVCLYGNAQISTQAIRELLYRGVPVSLFTTGGWFCGRLVGTDSKNVAVRIAQFKHFADDKFCLQTARGIVASKIKNCRTILRRNADSEQVLDQLDRAAEQSERAQSLGALLGIEGTAARVYFGEFSTMLKADISFAFDGRNRRPPRDPINALLSLAYALLTKDLTIAISAAGLDPMLGFYHQPRFGRPSLALDLMEEFRPIVADSVVVTAINTSEITSDDFVCVADAVSLKPHARRRFIQAYERRLDALVTHPVFGYRISYRRVLEVQARLMTRVLLGEIANYPQFRTR